MALHNIKIIVVDGGRAGSYKEKNASGGKSGEQSDAKKSLLYKMFHMKETTLNKLEEKGVTFQPQTLMGIHMGAQITKQVVQQSVNYYVSDIGRKNGDSNYQQMVDRTFEIAGDITGIASGALSGATAGSMFAAATGGLSVVVGAVLGAASSGISTAFKYAEKNRAYQWELFQQSTSQSYNLARANYSATTGRLR